MPLPETEGVAYPIVTTSRNDSGQIIQMKTTFKPAIGYQSYDATNPDQNQINSVRRRSNSFVKASILFADERAGGGLVFASEEVEQEFYDFEGKPVRKQKVRSVARGTIDPVRFRFSSAKKVASIETETWEFNSFKQAIARSTITRVPASILFGDPNAGEGLAFSNAKLERWIKVGVGRYKHITDNFAARGLINPLPGNPYDDSWYLVGSEDEVVDSIPDPPFMEVPKPEELKLIRWFVETENNDEDPTTIDRRPSNIERGRTPRLDDDDDPITSGDPPPTTRGERFEVLPHINSPEQAQKVAQTIMQIEQGRRYPHTIIRPLDKYTLLNFKPFEIEDVGDGRYIRDGFAIKYAEGVLECQYTGLQVGLIPEVTRPVHRAMLPGSVLAIAPIPNYA